MVAPGFLDNSEVGERNADRTRLHLQKTDGEHASEAIVPAAGLIPL